MCALCHLSCTRCPFCLHGLTATLITVSQCQLLRCTVIDGMATPKLLKTANPQHNNQKTSGAGQRQWVTAWTISNLEKKTQQLLSGIKKRVWLWNAVVSISTEGTHWHPLDFQPYVLLPNSVSVSLWVCCVTLSPNENNWVEKRQSS